NASLREVQIEAAELKPNPQRENASNRQYSKAAVRQHDGDTIGPGAESTQGAWRSIMGPVWLAAMVGGVMGGADGGVAVWLAAGGMQ
ncbi:hypothetical protein, partial [Xanthomonas perforans]|uniref:hypothetical protein n=1 Tax=Xanthomonas perforans TaxID=442694 RepID=UPI001930F204